MVVVCKPILVFSSGLDQDFFWVKTFLWDKKKLGSKNVGVKQIFFGQAQARLRHSGSVRLKLRLSDSGSITQAQLTQSLG